MLQSVHVKNLALIEEIEVDFKEGLNIHWSKWGTRGRQKVISINQCAGNSSVLEMQKRIGVYVDSASFMMSPQKSVTAVVGISNSAAKQGADKSKRCDLKCANCGNINCQFRKV